MPREKAGHDVFSHAASRDESDMQKILEESQGGVFVCVSLYVVV
jgi:hypothetical protein